MNTKNSLSYLFSIVIFALIIGCKSDNSLNAPKNDFPYNWVHSGYNATFRYFDINNDTVSSTMTVRVNESESPELFQIQTIIEFPDIRIDEIKSYKHTPDGIFESICIDDSLEFQLYLPYPIIKDFQYHHFACSGDTSKSFKIINVNEKVSVPMGTFETFIVRLDDNSGRIVDSYYDINQGLIKIEHLQGVYINQRWEEDPEANPYAGYELVSKN